MVDRSDESGRQALPPARRFSVAEIAERLERQIEAARQGDTGAALVLLSWAADCLERRDPLPDRLADYVAAAFREILKSAAPPSLVNGPPIQPGTPEWSDYIRGYAHGDTNADAALNLKRGRGKNQPEPKEMNYVHMALFVRMRVLSGESEFVAVREVAGQFKANERTVQRAYHSVKERRPDLLGLAPGDKK